MNEMKTELRIKVEGYGSLEGFSKCYEAVFNDGDTAKRYIHSLHKRIALCINSSEPGRFGKSVTIKHSDGVAVIPAELLRYTTTDIVIISGGDSTTNECERHCDCGSHCDCEERDDVVEYTVDDVWECDIRNARETVEDLYQNGILPSSVVVSPYLLAILDRYNSQEWHACTMNDISLGDSMHVINEYDIIVISQIGRRLNIATLRRLGVDTLQDLIGMNLGDIMEKLASNTGS